MMLKADSPNLAKQPWQNLVKEAITKRSETVVSDYRKSLMCTYVHTSFVCFVVTMHSAYFNFVLITDNSILTLIFVKYLKELYHNIGDVYDMSMQNLAYTGRISCIQHDNT